VTAPFSRGDIVARAGDLLRVRTCEDGLLVGEFLDGGGTESGAVGNYRLATDADVAKWNARPVIRMSEADRYDAMHDRMSPEKRRHLASLRSCNAVSSNTPSTVADVATLLRAAE